MKVLSFEKIKDETITLICSTIEQKRFIFHDNKIMYDSDKLPLYKICDRRELHKIRVSETMKFFTLCIYNNEVCAVRFGIGFYKKKIEPAMTGLIMSGKVPILNVKVIQNFDNHPAFPSYDDSVITEYDVNLISDKLKDDARNNQNYWKGIFEKNIWYNNNDFVKYLEDNGYSVAKYRKKIRNEKFEELGL
jgi:hypothetical protein